MKIVNKILNKTSSYYEKKFENNLRSRLNNKDCTIICSNCIGGIIYNRLGLKFLSPTINLWMWQYDYLKFVLNLEYYLSFDLSFIETELNYPVAKLNDITIYFNHYKNVEDAKNSWERRKKRINYNNLFLIMYDKDGLTKKDLEKLKNVKCKGKIVISNNVYQDLNYVIKLSANMEDKNKRYRLDRSIFTGIRRFERNFDYVKWLNEGN